MYKVRFNNLSIPWSPEYVYFTKSIGIITMWRLAWIVYKVYGTSRDIEYYENSIVYKDTSKYGQTILMTIEEAETDSDGEIPNPV